MPWFPYTALGRGVPRPYLFVWDGRTPAVPAVVDSGADESCIPEGIAELWRVPHVGGQDIGGHGAGGNLQARRSTQDVRLLSVCGVLVLERPLVLPSLAVVLLGRRDVFMQYQFAFDEPMKRFFMERHDP